MGRSFGVGVPVLRWSPRMLDVRDARQPPFLPHDPYADVRDTALHGQSGRPDFLFASAAWSPVLPSKPDVGYRARSVLVGHRAPIVLPPDATEGSRQAPRSQGGGLANNLECDGTSRNPVLRTRPVIQSGARCCATTPTRSSTFCEIGIETAVAETALRLRDVICHDTRIPSSPSIHVPVLFWTRTPSLPSGRPAVN